MIEPFFALQCKQGLYGISFQSEKPNLIVMSVGPSDSIEYADLLSPYSSVFRG